MARKKKAPNIVRDDNTSSRPQTVTTNHQQSASNSSTPNPATHNQPRQLDPAVAALQRPAVPQQLFPGTLRTGTAVVPPMAHPDANLYFDTRVRTFEHAARPYLNADNTFVDADARSRLLALAEAAGASVSSAPVPAQPPAPTSDGPSSDASAPRLVTAPSSETETRSSSGMPSSFNAQEDASRPDMRSSKCLTEELKRRGDGEERS